MIVIRGLVFLFLFASVFGCDDECSPNENCLKEILAQHEMSPYYGEELGCRFFLSMYSYHDKQYFRLDNHCADMETFYIDCDGNKVCDGATASSLCSDFQANAAYIGIVGIDLN